MWRYGYAKQARIGILVQEVTPELAAAFGLPMPTGALVTAVERGSPAEKGGLRASDVVLAINGWRLARSCQLPAQTQIWLPKELLRLTVWRNRAEVKIDVRAAEVSPK